MIRSPSRRSALIALPMTLCCAVAFAAPTVVPYSGYLTDADGQPYSGGADVMASLYPCALGGDGTCDQVYEAPTFLGLSVTGGVLAFELGAEADSTLAEVLTDGSDLWMEIALRLDGAATWTVLDPRHRLLSVPYAVSAHDADRLGGMDAADYATAAEIATHVSLQQVADAGYLKEDQLATAGYVTTVTLNDYALTSDLSEYATTAALASYPTFEGMQTSLGQYALKATLNDYVQEEDLSNTLDAYVQSSALDAAVAAQLTGLVTEVALNAALAGVVDQDDLDNYVTVADHTAAIEPLALAADLYTNDDALSAVEGEGYAKLTDIPAHSFQTTTSTQAITLGSDITEEKTVTLSFPVAAKIAKSHIRVDLQIRTELSVDYMVYASPPNSVAAEVTHAVHLASGFADPPIYTDRLIQSPPREEGDSVTKGDMKQYSYLISLSDSEITNGADVEVKLTAKCYAVPSKTDIGCSVYVGLERITITGF